MIYNIGAICGGILFGTLSERFGRRRCIIIAALLSLPVIPLWAFSDSPVLLAIGAFLMQFTVQGAWGVVPVHLNELSPDTARGTFPGFVYQLGNLLASVNATLQAGIASHFGGDYGLALAVVAGSVAIIIAVLTAVGTEAKGIAFANAKGVVIVSQSMLPSGVLECRKTWSVSYGVSCWVASVSHGHPEARITMNYPVIDSSWRAAFLVTGREKAAILRAIRAEGSETPASRVRPVGELILFVDQAAASKERMPNRARDDRSGNSACCAVSASSRHAAGIGVSAKVGFAPRAAVEDRDKP